ncbi:MAG: integrating conjugative element protein (TIGR03761 family) [Gammaproteobacteria bacterium]|jgi:integrating conjugative element protein (TIGR03761 family)
MNREAKMNIPDDDPDDLDLYSEETELVSRSAHADHADPIVDPSIVNKQPGRVTTTAQLTLHTKLSHRLFYGRKKSVITEDNNGKIQSRKVLPIIGLVRFVSNINVIHDLASSNDPYADNVLLEIELSLKTVTEAIDSKVEELEQLIDAVPGISIQLSASIEPVKIPLEFRTPFGFVAARLLQKYDTLVLNALAARQIGLIFDSDWNRVVNKTGSSIRALFLMSTQYRATGATRDDIVSNSPKARKAIELYGELPKEVLEGRKRSRWAPKLAQLS